jgi:hypothetical protein
VAVVVRAPEATAAPAETAATRAPEALRNLARREVTALQIQGRQAEVEEVEAGPTPARSATAVLAEVAAQGSCESRG